MLLFINFLSWTWFHHFCNLCKENQILELKNQFKIIEVIVVTPLIWNNWDLILTFVKALSIGSCCSQVCYGADVLFWENPPKSICCRAGVYYKRPHNNFFSEIHSFLNYLWTPLLRKHLYSTRLLGILVLQKQWCLLR